MRTERMENINDGKWKRKTFYVITQTRGIKQESIWGPHLSYSLACYPSLAIDFTSIETIGPQYCIQQRLNLYHYWATGFHYVATDLSVAQSTLPIPKQFKWPSFPSNLSCSFLCWISQQCINVTNMWCLYCIPGWKTVPDASRSKPPWMLGRQVISSQQVQSCPHYQTLVGRELVFSKHSSYMCLRWRVSRRGRQCIMSCILGRLSDWINQLSLLWLISRAPGSSFSRLCRPSTSLI